MSIKRRVDFAAVEELSQVLQRVHLFLLKVPGIDGSLPVLIRKTGGSNKNIGLITQCFTATPEVSGLTVSDRSSLMLPKANKKRINSLTMNAALLRAQIEADIPSAFALYRRQQQGSIRTGIPPIDDRLHGVPLHALTEICGSNSASSGKTSVLISLLAHASQDHFCALVDAGDSFDPVTAQVTGTNFSRLLWVRCGKGQTKLKPLEQAFKVTDLLLQSNGFGLIAVDLSHIPERFVRNVPLSSWFRFSRVVEKHPTALVFIEQQPHATSCAGLVLRLTASRPAVFSGNMFARFSLRTEVVRTQEKKPAHPVKPEFSLKTQWA